MKKLFLFVTFVMLIAGWTLAAASLHVVRMTGPVPKVGRIVLVPKERITFRQTYVDVSGWSAEQLAAHPSLGRKLTLRPAAAAQHEFQRVEAGLISAPAFD